MGRGKFHEYARCFARYIALTNFQSRVAPEPAFVASYACTAMSYRVSNPLWRWAILGIAILAAVCLPYTGIQNWRADRASAPNTIAGFERAAAIEPGYAFYWYALGANRRLDLDNPNPKEAIVDFRRALANDPRDARAWMDLGDASEETGDVATARRAYDTAVEAYPGSSDVHWRYGSFLLRQGDSAGAYSQIRLALTITPDLTPLVISRVWRATQDTGALLTKVLPSSGYYGYALTWFCGDADADAALVTWKKIVAGAPSIELKAAFPLINLLLDSFRGDDARLVWRQALNLSGHGAEIDAGPSLVFNGGFEFDSLNGGLDWRLEPRDGVIYEYDTAQHHGGSRSLHVSFDGSENFDFHQVTQQVPVSPSTRYRFSGFLRTAGITTESGMRFVITFPENFLPPIVLESVTGDKDWTEQTAEFTTGPQVHSITIMLARLTSRKFDNKLLGSVWADDVSLVPADSAAGGSRKAAQ